MAGNTSRIDIAVLAAQWASHSSYAAICSFWTVTREQVIRLKHVIPLPPRHDRHLRFRPGRSERPSDEENAASEASLSLAPMVAERATCITSQWTEEVRMQRQVTKPTLFRLTPVEMPEHLRDVFDGLNRDSQW